MKRKKNLLAGSAFLHFFASHPRIWSSDAERVRGGFDLVSRELRYYLA
jgi:hypothetical protein